MKILCIWAAAVFGAVAALLWFKASVIAVAPAARAADEGWAGAQIVVSDGKRDIDPFATAAAQSRWNMWAAAASVAAIFQAVSLILPEG